MMDGDDPEHIVPWGQMQLDDLPMAAGDPPSAGNVGMSDADQSADPPNHIIAANLKTQSKHAKILSICNPSYKLRNMDSYDIGGTMTDSERDLYFYTLTSVSPGYNYLMNLFVCCRRKTSFSIGISKSNELTENKTKKNESSSCTLPNTLSWQTFRAAQPDECFYIKTYCFSNSDLKLLEKNNILYIPIRIEMNSRHILDSEVVTRIKVDHEFSALLAKQEKTDFTLQSASGNTYPVHKVILAAHSPVLRELIRDDNTTTTFLDITDEDMELLLQFVYTGTIKDIMKINCSKLLQLAIKFELQNLLLLTQYVVCDKIDINNAIEIAAISEKYKLMQLQNTVFNFIKNHPEVLETEGWLNLNDVNLTKKLFVFMQRRLMRMNSYC